MINNKVIIIDSGIAETYINVNAFNVFMGRNFCDLQNKMDIIDHLGHGTSIANIIFSVNKDVEFIVLKIYNEDFQQDINILIRALQYILSMDAHRCIIHMSVGIDFYCEELFKMCKKLSDTENIIVAAFDNMGCVSYPAAFDCVIGVEGNAACIRTNDFVLNNGSIVDVYAKGGNHRVVDVNGKALIRQGNSYSAAFVTAFLSKCQLTYYSKEYAMAALQEGIHTQKWEIRNKNNYFDEQFKFTKEDNAKVKKIGVFPYNKEISTLVRFMKYMKYELVDIFSSKYQRNIGLQIRNKDEDTEYTIKRIEEISNERIDTLVIGHISQLECYLPGTIKTIIEKCLHTGINVYALDTDLMDSYYDKFKEKGLFLRCPIINKSKIKKQGKLFQISIPIVGVFGTSSKQGKYSLQLELIHQLEIRNYFVGFLATEPTGELFGADCVFPYGYEGVRNITDYDFIDLVNTQLHEIEMLGKEIIVTGAQSRSIPDSYMNLGLMAIKQIEFLLAIHPDVVLLCINYDDDINYIMRTISVIENIAETKVLGLVIFPMGYQNAWEKQKGKAKKIEQEKLEKIRNFLQNEIQCNIYILGEESTICNDIIEYF